MSKRDMISWFCLRFLVLLFLFFKGFSKVFLRFSRVFLEFSDYFLSLAPFGEYLDYFFWGSGRQFLGFHTRKAGSLREF